MESSWSTRWSGETAVRSHARESRPLAPVHGLRHRLSGAGSGSGPDRAGSIGRPDPPDAGQGAGAARQEDPVFQSDRKSTRLNSSHRTISYAVFCLKKKKIMN